MVSKNRLRRVSSVSRPMRSRTLISELSQGTPEVKIRLKWGLEVTISTLETLALRAGCPGSRYRVLVWLWTPNIDWDMTKCRLRVCSRKPLIFDVYFSVHHCPDLDWFRRFLTGCDTVLQFSWISHVIEASILSFGRRIVRNSPLSTFL